MSNLCSTCLLHDDQLSTVTPELLVVLTNLLQSSQFNYKLNGDAIKICSKCNSALQDMNKFREIALKNLEYLNTVAENAPKLITKVKILKIEPVRNLTKIIKKPIKAKKIVKKETVIPPLPPNMVTPVVDLPQPQPQEQTRPVATIQVLDQQTIQPPTQNYIHQQTHDMSMTMNQMGSMMDLDMSIPMTQIMVPRVHNKVEITINPETKLEYANLQPSMMTQAGVSGMHGMHPHNIVTTNTGTMSQMMSHTQMNTMSHMVPNQKYHQLQPAPQPQPQPQPEPQRVDKDFGIHYLQNTQYFIKVLSNDEVLQRMEQKRRKKEFTSAKHKCKHCVIIFKTAEQAKTHHSECHHESRGRFQCFICTRRFTSMVTMNKHISLHCTNMYVCSKCSYESVDKRSLQTHICKRVSAKRNLNLNYGRKLTVSKLK